MAAVTWTRSSEDVFVNRLIGTGSRKGSTFFSRAGDVIQRPPSWAAVAAVLAATGPRGRRAALRGGACYLSAAAVHLPIKRFVGRRHPPGAFLLQLGPFTSSFPSGHAAADLAFVFGAAQELPLSFVPLSCATLAVHWSLIRKRAHYPSDVVVGGALGIAVSLASRKVWPPTPRDPAESAGSDAAEGADPPSVPGQPAANGAEGPAVVELS